MKTSEKPITVEETYNKPMETVWKAITEPQQMRQWFFENIPDFKPETGFKVKFNVENNGRVFPHHWRIIRVEPGRLIEYDWSYDGYQGRSHVLFELSTNEKGTWLKLTNTVVQDFQDDIPEFTWESCQGGWIYFIKVRLKAYLA